MGGTGFDAGGTALAMRAQITFQRLNAIFHDPNLHCPERARHHTAFAADTASLLNEPGSRSTVNGPRRADIRAGRIFTLVAAHGRGEGTPLNHADP
ncbi:hypothetical protein FJMB80182_46200 [Enterobacter hormaechei]|nr:hypothetical protein SL264_44910 [Enterobacter cloacae]BCZ64715.1 hypothetical protein SL269_44990 [Klebsiella aerogenes]BDK27824.1 hypothetical protein FJMB80063_45030 [Enterobacter hormaechei]BDK48490.1 hypothetical protein FJMB80146_45990 [Enterobacter hormaechei]BDK58875.1 hypothetical protein FJMB80152_45950 [Enterobacter hormaechei]